MFGTSQDNTIAVLSELLRVINVSVTNATLTETLRSHPGYPGIGSLSDALSEFNVENGVFRLSRQQLAEIENPFIAHTTVNNGYFVLVISQNSNTISLYNPAKGFYNQTPEEFYKVWSGYVLIAEPDENSGEKDYRLKRRVSLLNTLRIPTIVILALLVLVTGIASFEGSLPWLFYAYTFTKTAGTFVSVLLVINQYGKVSAFLNKICHISQKSDCASVIFSPSARILRVFTWSEVGLLYFAGGLFTIAIAKHIAESLPYLQMLTVVALPFTFWSIYTQWRVIRQWCTLCLITQALLIIEFLLVLSMNHQAVIHVSVKGLSAIFSGFGSVLLVWLVVKPILVNATRGGKSAAELNIFKRNSEVFRVLLYQQPRIAELPEDIGAIHLGNPDAGHTVTLVANLFCKACSSKFLELEKIARSSADVNFRIIFLTSFQSPEQQHLALYVLHLPPNGQMEAIKSWYEKDNTDPVDFGRSLSASKTEKARMYLERQNVWCEINRIKTTPTLFFDNYLVPEMYSLKDLKLLTAQMQNKSA
ncbi:cysteine peptidase family C39 domain-containing protein [Emticicia sp. 21SJ11W-3]|uniref:cysteine peptidase family C39 domain-containing protein n=1 Tax=Emticicia sp. 21SJ11W-3 TaxID=2916755 RepID=UPI00209DAD67|nr:cysteine peptidase family C39 domain-containing protein [Emticicia sp. 21SJ11W-3]UTA68047.1 cysteine peptidase family C39 domain-containing protein [Emticicia sp. 21SJ11W-3]